MLDGKQILDSGQRREFDSGAVRDIVSGKGRCDLLPLDVVSQWVRIYDRKIGDIIHSIYQYIHDCDVACLYDALGLFTLLKYDNFYNAVLELSHHYEQGADKYGERNWEKGIPLHCYIDSAIRHLLKWGSGMEDEPHDRAFMWNIVGAIWTIKHHPELDDIPHNLV